MIIIQIVLFLYGNIATFALWVLSLTQETEQIENLLGEIDKYVNAKPKSELIGKSQGLC